MNTLKKENYNKTAKELVEYKKNLPKVKENTIK